MPERAKTLQQIREEAKSNLDKALKKFCEGLARQPGDEPSDREARIKIKKEAVEFLKNGTSSESTDNT